MFHDRLNHRLVDVDHSDIARIRRAIIDVLVIPHRRGVFPIREKNRVFVFAREMIEHRLHITICIAQLAERDEGRPIESVDDGEQEKERNAPLSVLQC